jgi:hypothetical protein
MLVHVNKPVKQKRTFPLFTNDLTSNVIPNKQNNGKYLIYTQSSNHFSEYFYLGKQDRAYRSVVTRYNDSPLIVI